MIMILSTIIKKNKKNNKEMKTIFIFSHPQEPLWPKFCKHLEYVINRFGENFYRAIHVTEFNKDKDNGELWITFSKMDKYPQNLMYYNLDPMIPNVLKDLHHVIEHCPSVKFYDYSSGKNESTWLKEFESISRSMLYYGYSFYHKFQYDQYVTDKNVMKDVDVLFYGCIWGRRLTILQQLYQFCQLHNIKILIFNDNLKNDSEKFKMIARTKIIINVASDSTKPNDTNDLCRISQLLSIGSFMISEYHGDEKVESRLSKYVPFYNTPEELCETVKFYLDNESKRLEMIEKASNEFPLDFNFDQDLINIIHDIY